MQTPSSWTSQRFGLDRSPVNYCAEGQVGPTTNESQSQSPENKRLAIFLDVCPSQAETTAFQCRGITLVKYKRLGALDKSTFALNTIKVSMRRGKVSWIDGAASDRGTQNPSWLAQFCRTAHRAGEP